MSEAVMRVRVTEVVPEFSAIDPPMQPPGAEVHMLLGNCPKWVLEWPKTQIRLGGLRRRSTGATSKPRKPIVRPSKPPRKHVEKELAPQAAVATTRKEPPVVATTSRHQRLLGMSVPQQPSEAKDVAPQLDGNDDDDENIDVDGFLNTGASKDLYMPAMDEEPFRAHGDQPGRRTTCQRLSFSQNTPPEAGDQAPDKTGNIFSPGTLTRTVCAGFTAPPPSPEKIKKSKKRCRQGTSTSQPAPKVIRGHEDMTSPRADSLTRVHVAGKPLLPPELLCLAKGPMLSLHEAILMMEGLLLKDKNPNYPVLTVQVPKNVDFVTEAPADLFFIAFEDVFNLFHSRRLDYNLVRLYAINMAMKIQRDVAPYVTVVDPYYMRDSQLVEGSTTRDKATEYLKRFMLNNKRKNNLLLPFFPE